MKTFLLGDLSPTVITDPLFASGDKTALFGDTLPLFEGNDLNFVNLECALTDSENGIEKFGPCLKACPQVAKTLREIGVNCCGLSNNHVFDFGVEGIRDTLSALQDADMPWTGFGLDYDDSRKDFVLEKDGETLSVITVCEHEYSYALEDRMGSRPYDEYDTMLDIRKAKERGGRVIVVYHGGKEQCRYPSPRLRRLCRAMVRNGADLVLCQHSHCVGCYELFEGGHILYGQGNFHFIHPELSANVGWNDCLGVRYDTVTHAIEFLPMVVDGSGIRLAAGAEKEEILSGFAARNQSLLDESWKEGWHDFCLWKEADYKRAICNACRPESGEWANNLFGHYLDCEAHTDVWRELFPTANQTNEKGIGL